MKHTFFEKFHCLLPDTKVKQQIERLLQTKDYESIDMLVYELYGLDKEEIEFIEEKSC